ncbi:MAG: hypothetical protein HYS05_01795 [Acidobacteria bacterium]|nr:hypothetical protein [Acidobacteriota bacterium]
MADEYGWSDAWQDLLVLHTPFRASENENFQDLLRQLSAIEQLFLEHLSLQAYYLECMELSPGPTASPSDETVHMCAMQLQLMEDAYFSLRLDQFANAPDNRGWMNLFRRWGRSSLFQIQFLALQSTFSIQFVEFYQNYVENWDPIDDARRGASLRFGRPDAEGGGDDACALQAGSHRSGHLPGFRPA